MGVKRVQHATHIGKQGIVIRQAFACTGQDGLKATGFGRCRYADIKGMDHGCKTHEAAITVEAKTCQQHFEGHAIAHM